MVLAVLDPLSTGALLTRESWHSSLLVLTSEGGHLTHAPVDLLCAFHLENSYNGAHCGWGSAYAPCQLDPPHRLPTHFTLAKTQLPIGKALVGQSPSGWRQIHILGRAAPCVLTDSPICSKQTFVMWNFKFFCLILFNGWLNRLGEIFFFNIYLFYLAGSGPSCGTWALEHTASVAAACGLSCSIACGRQILNPWTIRVVPTGDSESRFEVFSWVCFFKK